MSSWESGLTKVPPHMHGAVQRYMTHGISPGGFLYAVLSNDLKGAFGKADDTNSYYLHQWVEYVVWDLPALAQGSPERVQTWMAHNGLSGMNEYYARQAAEVEAIDASTDLHE